MPASPCLSPFSLSVVDHYADETENDESRLVSLGPTVDKRAGGNARLSFFRVALRRKTFFGKPLDKKNAVCYNQVNR
jgi:hypothetical protein